jgi:outer membrane immunogenic protein
MTVTSFLGEQGYPLHVPRPIPGRAIGGYNVKTQSLLASIATVIALAATPATAADMRMPVKAPPAPPLVAAYNWTGFYIGGHAGGGFGEKCFTFEGDDRGCHDTDGFVGGGQIGFNVQSNQFVFGVEFSGSWADLSGSHTAPVFSIFGTHSLHSDVSTILLLTGRVGLAFDRALLYVSGGGAWVRDKFEVVTVPFGSTASTKQNRTGWTVGAGLEYGLAPNWSIALQYNYIDLGDKGVTFDLGAGPFTYQADQHIHLATARLNYRFGGFGGGPVAARY